MKIRVIRSCSSTNDELKKDLLNMKEGSPLPPALVADEQTAGRGRSGRTFSSPAGKGLYISMPLALSSIEDAMCIMPMTSVCVCRAIEELSGIPCQIKWPNDVLIDGKKVCGILTELINKDGKMFLVTGIGVNLLQDEEDYPRELREKAVSLKQVSGKNIDPETFAAVLTSGFDDMIKALPQGKADYLEYYRSHCTLTGRKINVFFAEGSEPVKAEAIEITEDFRLLVKWEDGRRELLNTGEVSVR